MSYCRFSEGDIYVFFNTDHQLECCVCWLPGGTKTFPTTRGMVEHLAEHVAAGHDVPSWVIPELWAEDPENFPVPAAGDTDHA